MRLPFRGSRLITTGVRSVWRGVLSLGAGKLCGLCVINQIRLFQASNSPVLSLLL